MARCNFRRVIRVIRIPPWLDILRWMKARARAKATIACILNGNGDLDLQNDAVLRPHSDPPDGLLTYNSIRQQVLFEFVNLEFDCGPQGKRTVEVLPRFTLSVYDGVEYKEVSLVRTRAYAGDIKMGEESYRVRLGNDYVVTGSLDAPYTAVVLENPGGGEAFSWWGGDRLGATHKAQGKFYRLSVTPDGKQLTVRPYEGDLGIFEVGPGTLKVEGLSVSGSVDSREGSVPVGGNMEGGRPMATRSCSLPTGITHRTT